MLRRNRREQAIGLIVAVLVPVFGITILQESYPKVDFSDFQSLEMRTLSTQLLMVAVIINALIFGVSMRLKRDGLARGILLGSLISAAAIVYIKFFA